MRHNIQTLKEEIVLSIEQCKLESPDYDFNSLTNLIIRFKKEISDITDLENHFEVFEKSITEKYKDKDNTSAQKSVAAIWLVTLLEILENSPELKSSLIKKSVSKQPDERKKLFLNKKLKYLGSIDFETSPVHPMLPYLSAKITHEASKNKNEENINELDFFFWPIEENHSLLNTPTFRRNLTPRKIPDDISKKIKGLDKSILISSKHLFPPAVFAQAMIIFSKACFLQKMAKKSEIDIQKDKAFNDSEAASYKEKKYGTEQLEKLLIRISNDLEIQTDIENKNDLKSQLDQAISLSKETNFIEGELENILNEINTNLNKFTKLKQYSKKIKKFINENKEVKKLLDSAKEKLRQINNNNPYTKETLAEHKKHLERTSHTLFGLAMLMFEKAAVQGLLKARLGVILCLAHQGKYDEAKKYLDCHKVKLQSDLSDEIKNLSQWIHYTSKPSKIFDAFLDTFMQSFRLTPNYIFNPDLLGQKSPLGVSKITEKERDWMHCFNENLQIFYTHYIPENAVQKEDKIIGSGGHGRVYQGELLGQKIVVKINKNDNNFNFLDEIEKESLEMELKLWKDFSSHKNIVSLLGITLLAESPGIIMLYIGPSLEKILTDDSLNKIAKDYWKEISYGIINGLYYLHTLSLIHRDIKPGNILVDNEGNTKITDFGTTIKDSKLEKPVYPAEGTSQYQNAYLFRQEGEGEIISHQSDDVFAYALTILYLLTLNPPWSDETFSKGRMQFINFIRGFPIPKPPTLEELDHDSQKLKLGERMVGIFREHKNERESIKSEREKQFLEQLFFINA